MISSLNSNIATVSNKLTNITQIKKHDFNVTCSSGGSANTGLSATKVIIGVKLNQDGKYSFDRYEGNVWMTGQTANSSHTGTIYYMD